MKKLLVCVMALVLAMCLLCGCSQLGIELPDVSVESAVLDTVKTYSIGAAVDTLDISINAASLTIREGESFGVESNLKYLTVSEQSGTLRIEENLKMAVTATTAMVTITIPTGTVFDAVSIKTGAGKVTADALRSGNLVMELGAGDVQFAMLEATQRAEISGGAGKITIAGGTLKDLELEMGVGSLELTAQLPGNSELFCGVGTTRVTLVGGEEFYSLDVEKGVGVVNVCGELVSNSLRYGSGMNRVDIEGGVGTVNVTFAE